MYRDLDNVETIYCDHRGQHGCLAQTDRHAEYTGNNAKYSYTSSQSEVHRQTECTDKETVRIHRREKTDLQTNILHRHSRMLRAQTDKLRLHRQTQRQRAQTDTVYRQADEEGEFIRKSGRVHSNGSFRDASNGPSKTPHSGHPFEAPPVVLLRYLQWSLWGTSQ